MAPEVTTTCGRLRGREEHGIHVFRGIPYAAPPIGERRWRPPAPPASWSGVRDAFLFGNAAPQEPSAGEREGEPLARYLNVWTPATAGSRPVMVWIHGGLVSGSGCQSAYDGRHLCRRDVVVVTINYRLGVYGFTHLAGPTGDAIPATGNEGHLDQAAALPGCATISPGSAATRAT